MTSRERVKEEEERIADCGMRNADCGVGKKIRKEEWSDWEERHRR
jgi:hypothetical protein